MHDETRLLAGGMAMLGVATGALVVIPYLTVRDTPPPNGLKPYTAAELRGRQQYIAQGCVYCHSQQPRAKSFAPDFDRGWGRASVAADYASTHPISWGRCVRGQTCSTLALANPASSGTSVISTNLVHT